MLFVLPYLSFLSYVGFSFSVVLYILVPLFISLLGTVLVLKDELLSFGRLKEFAKALKDEKWSSRVENINTTWFSEIAQTLNMAADRFERKQNELRQVIDLVPGFIYAKDAKGNITLANKAFATFIGKAPQEIVGNNETQFDKIS